MKQKQVSTKDHLKAIFALPFVVTIVIPGLIYFFIDRKIFELFSKLPDGVNTFLGGFFFGLGCLLFVITIRLFDKKGKGTLAPWNPPAKLVIEGPFRYVRNPMLLGVNFILLAIACVLENENTLLWCIFFVALNTVYFIKKEEPDLVKRFGNDYVEYCKHVGRWIPRLTPWNFEESN